MIPFELVCGYSILHRIFAMDSFFTIAVSFYNLQAVSGTTILHWTNWNKLLDHRTPSIDILQNNIAAVAWKCIAFLKIDHRIIYKQFGVKPCTHGMGENIRNAL